MAGVYSEVFQMCSMLYQIRQSSAAKCGDMAILHNYLYWPMGMAGEYSYSLITAGNLWLYCKRCIS
jgi:hypothetical protein